MKEDHWIGIHQSGNPAEPAEFRVRPGQSPDLLDRWSPFADWLDRREDTEALPFPLVGSGGGGSWFTGRTRAGRPLSGVNFAGSDHLNLAGHPRVIAAADAALRRFGGLAAGGFAGIGGSATGAALETALAAFSGYAEATLFPSGWVAGYATVRTLLQPCDQVVAQTGLAGGPGEAVAASGARRTLLPQITPASLAPALRRLRAENLAAGILVVAQSLSAQDGRFADIGAVQDLCHRYRATLLLDVSHDFGLLGQSGRGVMDLHAMTGRVDVITGGLSRAFATNGGFVASNHRALRPALRHGDMATAGGTALAPHQIAAAHEALILHNDAEGAGLRARLMANVLQMRLRLADAGFAPMGDPGPLVLIAAGTIGQARRATTLMQMAGVIVPLAEWPAVEGNTGIWRLQVMVHHRPRDFETVISALKIARASATASPCLQQPRRSQPTGTALPAVLAADNPLSPAISATRTLPPEWSL